MFKRHFQSIVPAHLVPSIRALYLLIVVLQVLDALSTFFALETGFAQEQNQLLNAVAHFSQLHIMWVVVAAKCLVATLFLMAMKRTKPSWGNLFVLFGVAAFYMNVVSNNITLTWHIQNSQGLY